MTAAYQPDIGAQRIGPNPNWTFRVVALIQAGHTLDYILDLGRYEATWTKRDIEIICRRAHIPLPPRRHGHRPAAATGEAFPLHPRHYAIALHLIKGMTNYEISVATRIKEETVKADIRSIIRKSNRRDRIGLVVAILTKELIPIESEE